MLEGWVLVNISLERLTAVYFPLRHKQLYTKGKALLGLFVTFLICFGLNVIYLVIINDCPADTRYEHLLQIWGWVNVCFNSVIPFLLMLSCSLAIIVKICVTNIERRRMNVRADYRISWTTVSLLAVCITYLILTAPVFILLSIHEQYEKDRQRGIRSWQRVTDILIAAFYLNVFWYTNYVINFYIYCISNPKFRDQLLAIYKKGCCYDTQKVDLTTSVSHETKNSDKKIKTESERF